MNKKNGVLSDHKKINKKLITPVNQLTGGMSYIKWLDDILPELVWIALLQEKLGIKRSVEVCLKVASANKVINDVRDAIVNTHDRDASNTENDPVNLVLISNYSHLSSRELTILIESLNKEEMLDELLNALDLLLTLYPDCPLKVLYGSNHPKIANKVMLENFREILSQYFYRKVHLTNVLEATAGSMILATGRIKFVNGVRPPEYNNILFCHPNSNEYKKTAASIRAQTLMLVMHGAEQKAWPSYFWNRGLKIDDCKE